MNMITYGSGTAEDPWQLKTPPLTPALLAWCDPVKQELVVQVGSTRLAYRLRCLDDLQAMLAARGDWVVLGNADEGKPTPEGSVEARAPVPSNPVGGYDGTRKGYRGRFASYVPPVMELPGRAEVEHAARGNRMRAL